MTVYPAHAAQRSGKPTVCGPKHVNGGRQHALAQLLERGSLPQRLQAMPARTGRRHFDPRRDGVAVEVGLDLEQHHELLQELLDGIDSLGEGGGDGRRVRPGSFFN